MVKCRYILALALALIWLAFPLSLFAQNSKLPSLAALNKEDAKLRMQERALLGKLAPDDAWPIDDSESSSALDPRITNLSTATADLARRSDQLNIRLDAANKDAEQILLRAQLATEKIQQLQTSERFLNSDTSVDSTFGLPLAYVAATRASLVADPEQPELILATLLHNTPVFVEYLAQSQYRIVTSTGVRGWLSGSDIEFRPDDFHSGSSLVRIRAIQTAS